MTLIDRAKELDKHYIPTRYPNGFERGAPLDFRTRREAEEALIRRSMDDYAARLLSSHSEIREIVIFSSFAEGTYAPGSDLDILIVLDRSDRPVRDRIPAYLPGAFPVGVDLFPYTRDEIAARADSPVVVAARRSRWRYVRPQGLSWSAPAPAGRSQRLIHAAHRIL